MITTKINIKKRFFSLLFNSKKKYFHSILCISLSTISIVITLFIIIILILSLIVTLAYPKLPELDMLIDYRPKIPLRIFSADGILIGEFGKERREMVHFREIPELMKKAVLSIEDDRFYEHDGVDYQSILRAFFANLFGNGGGASTITQQVARNFFLTSNEPTFLQKVFRKFFYEIPLAWKIECNLTKTQILEVYMNQIYLGQRAYGFAAAAKTYFNKTLKELSIAEAAMLAGLPKAPSAYNPVVNPKRAYDRQQYILLRMYQLKYITAIQYQQAKAEQLKIKNNSLIIFKTHAEYVSELVRQLVYAQFKEDTYTHGLNVFTTITKADQDAAYQALRYGIINYEKRRSYRGPKEYIKIPLDAITIINHHQIENKFITYNDDLITAIVLETTPKEIIAISTNDYTVKISNNALQSVLKLLNSKEILKQNIKKGTIIRVFRNNKNWIITKMPEVQSAFISVNPHDGAIRSLVGGFDFNQNKFNHVTQAWRQPGSSLKPFIYSSSLEKGLSPATIINDAPLTFTQESGLIWQPKNYGGKFEGPISMRRALQKSINLVSIRILEYIGIKYAQAYLTRFGFDAEKNPPYLTLALGAGAVTPLQMVSAYSVFANGGYKINPYLISKITDNNGEILAKAQPIQSGDEKNRIIDPRNAFIMDNMLRDVIRHGTAFKAMTLKRTDLAGKTGTTNDAMDAWFAGYQPNLVAIAWMGYDQPKSLGDRETGGGLALPIWINYMHTMLKNIPIVERIIPNGLVEVNGDYYYAEYLLDNNINEINLLEKSLDKSNPQKEEI